jgi:2-octaprenylphenol hydroxylase
VAESAACSDVTLMAPAQIQQVAWGENEAFLTLQVATC